MKTILLLAMCAALLLGQSERGNITGVVTDASGGAVPGAELVIRHLATNTVVKLTTTANGEYNAAGLKPGEYSVDVTANGFHRFSQTNEHTTQGRHHPRVESLGPLRFDLALLEERQLPVRQEFLRTTACFDIH